MGKSGRGGKKDKKKKKKTRRKTPEEKATGGWGVEAQVDLFEADGSASPPKPKGRRITQEMQVRADHRDVRQRDNHTLRAVSASTFDIEPARYYTVPMTILSDDIAQAEALLTQVNAAIMRAVEGGYKEYRFDTGQTRTTVVKLDLMGLYKMRRDLKSEIASLKDSGTLTVGRFAC